MRRHWRPLQPVQRRQKFEPAQRAGQQVYSNLTPKTALTVHLFVSHEKSANNSLYVLSMYVEPGPRLMGPIALERKNYLTPKRTQVCQSTLKLQKEQPSSVILKVHTFFCAEQQACTCERILCTYLAIPNSRNTKFDSHIRM